MGNPYLYMGLPYNFHNSLHKYLVKNMTENQKMLRRCISKLESMAYTNPEGRPKTYSKLWNTLLKESRVISVCSPVLELLTLNIEFPCRRVEEVYKTDLSIDNEIAQKVKQLAEIIKERHLLVLPCDSDLHTQVALKVKTWYTRKSLYASYDGLITDLTSACTIDFDFTPRYIVAELHRLQFINICSDEVVKLTLPDTEAMTSLERSWIQYQQKIMLSLGDICERTHQIIAELMKNANDEIQKNKIDELGQYCEDVYTSKYPNYRNTQTQLLTVGRMIKDLSMEDMEISDIKNESNLEPEVRDQTNSNKFLWLWPLEIKAEIINAVLYLYKTNPKQQSLPEFENCIQNVCRVTYVATPKYILHELQTKKTCSDEKVMLHIGTIETIFPLSTRDREKVASILRFPKSGKSKAKTGHRNRGTVFECIDTSVDMGKNTFCALQKCILKHAQSKAQHRGASLIFDNADAQRRCKEKLMTFINERLHSAKYITVEELSKKIIELSQDETDVGTDALIRLLDEAGYLKIDNGGVNIRYISPFTLPQEVDENKEAIKFLSEWERYYVSPARETEDISRETEDISRETEDISRETEDISRETEDTTFKEYPRIVMNRKRIQRISHEVLDVKRCKLDSL